MYCKRKKQIIPEAQCIGDYREAVQRRKGLCHGCGQGDGVMREMTYKQRRKIQRAVRKAKRNLGRIKVKNRAVRLAKENTANALSDIQTALSVLGLTYEQKGKEGYGKHGKKDQRETKRLWKSTC